MTVQSARVQEIVKGDDVTLKHQIMKDVAYDAEASRAPVILAVTDKVTFFYQLQDGSNDQIGFDGVNAEAYPTSRFNVIIPGDIPAVGAVPERGSKMFLSGEALTVRAEITRDFATVPVKETHYLLAEVDVFERGFPTAPRTLNLP